MEIKLNLEENSKDFLINSFDIYKVANQNNNHLWYLCNTNYSKKWKTAFILLLQAFELLLKQALCEVNPALIYESIDVYPLKNIKTLNFSTLIKRINNIIPNLLKPDETELVINYVNIRNQFIHFEANYTTEEIKHKYCKLYGLYYEIYYKTFNSYIDINNEDYDKMSKEILAFAKDYTIFRGNEMRAEDKQELLLEIEENKRMSQCVDDKGNLYNRIKFGTAEMSYYKHNRPDILERHGYSLEHLDGMSLPFHFDYCGDCLAKEGEYHLWSCDLEICPKCGGQLIGCDCDLEIKE